MVELIADLERARLTADRHYNDTLTALDRAIVELGRQETLAVGDLARFATALILFLQQITAFVETKQRALDARLTEKIDTLAASTSAIAELRTQLALLRRATDRLGRTHASQPDTIAAAAGGSIAPPHANRALDDLSYIGFEDEFRGPEESIRARLREYLPLFAGASDVVDLGCGRGEFLQLLDEQGISARGVDASDEMAAAARARGLNAADGDALEFLAAAGDESLGGVMATQVIEHLEPRYLFQLLREARRALRPGAPIVLETINPACWLAFFSSYVRDLTHVRPVHPDTLQYLLRANGFERVSLKYSAPVDDVVRMKGLVLPLELARAEDPISRALAEAARIVNENASILNGLLFSFQDYAAIGYRP
jgi:O-antigen chain-terminating methyltransferase